MKIKVIFLVCLLLGSSLAEENNAFDGKQFADWESKTGAQAQENGKDVQGITFAELSNGNDAGILSKDITFDEELPHYSLEFEYFGRGQSFLWNTRPQLGKMAYAMLPFRENWQIRGPTVFEWDAKNTGAFFQFVCTTKKLNVNEKASAETLHLDNFSVQFTTDIMALDQYTNNNQRRFAQQKGPLKLNQFNQVRVYINPETDLIEVTASFMEGTLKGGLPAGYFNAHPYCSFKTQVQQDFEFKSIAVTYVNEYRMSPQAAWLRKRPEWKLQGQTTKFEWESDNRDCYFVCSPKDDWPINPSQGAFVILYGWDNTQSVIFDQGAEKVNNKHRLPTFKLGLFYGYSVTIDPTTSVLTVTSSAGLSMSHTFPANYFKQRPWCTFGVWAGMQGLTIRNIRRDSKEVAKKSNNFRGLKVGLVTASAKFFELLSPKFELPVEEWVRVSIRFSPTEKLAIPNVETEAFKIAFSDFGGDPNIEEVPIAGDFMIRRVTVKQTDHLYCVPANQLQNFFITGFGIDYSTSGDPLEINVQTRQVQVIGGNGNSVLDGDVIVGVDSVQSAIGTLKDDILIGDERDNVFEGNAGADKINGNGGSDTISYLHANAGVEVSLVTGQGYTGHAKGDELISIENIIGSEFDDILILGAEGGYCDGRGGTNTIVTSGKKDTVKLGEGVDTVHVHYSQQMLSVINFEGDEDHLLLLGARNEDDIHIEEYQNESTLITLNKSGGQIVLLQVKPDELKQGALVFYTDDAGTEKKCSDTGRLVQGRCLFNAPAGYFKLNEDIKKCSDTGCQICPDDKCIACQDDHFLDQKLGCEPCHDNCLKCTGPKDNNCSVCKGEQILKSGSCIDKPAECKETEFLDAAKNVCVKDEASCPQGFWGTKDPDAGNLCVADTDGSLKADYDVRTNPPKKEEKKQPAGGKDNSVNFKSDVNQGDCPILYTECDFGGVATEVCKPIPHLEESEIKSIYIPENFGKTVVLHKLPEFKGKTAKFKKSVKCLDDIDFHILEQYGINIDFGSDEEKQEFFDKINSDEEYTESDNQTAIDENENAVEFIQYEDSPVTVTVEEIQVQKNIRKTKQLNVNTAI